ncbi:MAG: methyltransferase domain-containing protein [Rhodobacteraceae bacterium]|nr:methyltransferase domain-containing protein [Paracoccaceae bacterium]
MSEAFGAFMQLYSGLPREGPGTIDSLLNVLEIADTPPLGRVLDAACGTGADSKILSRALPNVELIGVDKQAEFIEAAKARGLRADFRVGDMLWVEGDFDLIWCAGAVYFFGVETVLEAWRGHLRPGGKVAFSEVVWREQASAEAKAFWAEAYPAMDSQNGLNARIESCGFKVLSAEPLGRAGWEAYYNALRANIARLKGQNPVMDEVIAETEAEIAVYDAHFGEYDYVVYLVEPV